MPLMLYICEDDLSLNGGIAVGLSPACGDGREGLLSAVRLWRRRHVKPNFF